jgi:DeoR family galactitol utilization operon repressor
MRARAAESWLVADSSKYGRAGFVSVMELSALTGVITDDGLDAASRTDLNNSGPRVRIV